ncbi:hypothetical protein [Candidatus Nitrotoga sp. AM1P]|uniref:hypothetical protein n=1 Tax=Candidatus Nitrotoga sp. AM1P TaxID=2559597 RepID=UPI0010B23FA0|nr:hypothetical protein [Candidatus Nitrotoga sp. AM1P]BBJ23058.1 hypothetical protein W01_09850 [Candidatus Nitrotoga sp. AM1P]
MQTRFKNPLSGKPCTVESTDPKGLPTFTITPRQLTPLRAKLADSMSTVLKVVLTMSCIASQIYHPHLDWWNTIRAVLMYVIAYYILAWFVRRIFHRKTIIVMTTDEIRVRRWFGWQHFDRNLEHRFLLHVHDRTNAEQQRHEYEIRQASAKGRVIRKTVYYGESFHIVLLYAGHRKDMLNVYGHKESVAIIARLQYCDRCLNEAVNMGGGINKRPEDEWNHTPGGLNDV